MTPLTYLSGDATAPTGTGPKIIAHVCNDIGGWGRGFVLALSRRWPAAEADYRQWYRERESNDFGLGAVRFVGVADQLWVANMVAQRGVVATAEGPPIRYAALEQCLHRVAEYAREVAASVHMPRIGAGLAGGRWEEIEPIIVRTLCERDIVTVVYDLPRAGQPGGG